MKSLFNCLPPASDRGVTARSVVWLVALLVWFVSAGATVLRADPGDVDLSFHSGTGPNAVVFATVARTNDDKIYIGGAFDGYNGTVARRIARLTVSGALDPAFATPGCESSVNALALWPVTVTNVTDQKIIIVGDFTSVGNDTSRRVARLNDNGSLDLAFTANMGQGPDSGVDAVTVQADGKVIIGGRFLNFDNAPRKRIARLNADGTLDTTFDPGGGPNGTVVTINTQKDGKILLCGSFTAYNNVPNHEGIVRLNADGSLDATFSARAAKDTATGLVNGAVVQDDIGKIIVFGGFNVFNNTFRTKIVRLNLADGSIDTAWALNTVFNSDIRDARLLPSGKLLCVGVFNSINNVSRRGVARLDLNGNHDLGFNPGTGAGFNDGQTNANSANVNASALDSQRRLFIVGEFRDFNQIPFNFVTRVTTDDPAPPLVITQPVDLFIPTGSNATFSITANGTDPLAYQWRFNGAAIPGATNASITVTNAQNVNVGLYSIVVTNKAGSATSSNASLTLGTFPFFVTPPASQTNFVGANTNFSVTAGGTLPLSYQWYFNGGLLPGQNNPVLTLNNLQLTNGGTYTIVVGNLFGSVTNSATLTIASPPAIQAGPNGGGPADGQPQSLTVVQGQSATFSVNAVGSAPLTYQWQYGGVNIPGATNTSVTLNNVQAVQAGLYSVVITNPFGVTTSANATLTVLLPPTIIVQPVSQTITQGSTINLSVTATGSPTLTYQWSLNGTAIPGGTSATLSLFNAQKSLQGNYVCVVSNPYGTATSAVAVVTIQAPPVIFDNGQPQPQTVIQGSNATFSVTANGDQPFTYQWRFNGTNLVGATNNPLTLTGVLTNQAGNYSVVVSNPFGNVTSSNALLTVRVPPYIITQPTPTNQTVIVGSNATITVVAGGDPTLAYQWLLNGFPVLGANAATLTLNSVQLGQLGNYTVVVSNPYGSVTSTAATLNVKTAPFVATQPQSLTVLQGQPASFGVTAGGDGPFTYQWRFGGVPITGATNGSFGFGNSFPTNAGNYSVVITSPYGSVTSSNALLTVNVPPAIIVQPQATTGITGGSASFNVLATGDPTLLYQWSFAGAPIPGATNPTLTLTNLQTSQAGLYTVVVSNPFGTATSVNAPLTVKIAPFAATQPQSLTVVQGSNATFSVTAGGDGPFTYQWLYFGNPVSAATNSVLTLTGVVTNQAGNYSVVITSPYGSATSSDALLTVKVPPAIIVQPLSQTIIVGVTANLGVTATGDQPLSYQWRFNGNSIANATNSVLSLPAIQANQTGDYTVVVSNPYGTVTSAIATLSVKTPPFAATQPQSLSILQGSNATFTVTAGGDGPFTYQWLYGGISIPGATNATLALTNVPTSQAGNYSVVITSPYGSVTSANALLTVHVPPAITVQPLSQTIIVGVTANLAVVATGDQPLSYQWRFNGNAIANATNAILSLPAIQKSQTGDYTVVVSNPYGTATSSVATLTVKALPFAATQPQSLAILQGDNAGFSVMAGGDGPFTYQWLYGGLTIPGATNASLAMTNVRTNQAGNYSVIITSPYGSATSANALLTVHVPPSIVTPPVTQTVVAGVTVNFTVVAAGDLPLTYQWLFNGNPISGATNPTLSLAGVQTSQAGNYSVVVTNPYGTATSAIATLTVKAPPSVTTQPQSLTVLKGTNASFSVTAAGDAPITYQWRFGGVNLDGATNASLNLTNVQTNQAGLYSVVITSPYGSVTSSNATLTVLDPPVIVVQPTPATGLAGDMVAFVVVATGRPTLLYQWCKNGVDIPGATGAMLTLTNISAADVGNYCVKVTNPDGSVTSITVPLTLSQRTLTVVTVQTTNFTAGSPISVPVALLAEGGENRVLGSIAYDTNKLNFISVTTPVGATLAATNAAGQGQIGFDVALPAAQTFTPGSNVVVFVNFTVNAGVTQSICGINLQGVPVTNQVLNAVGAPLPSYFISGAVIFKSLTDYTLRSQTGATEDLMPVLNPAGSVSALTFLRISFFDLGKDSLGNAIYIINATGTNNGTPYILIPSTVAPAGTFPLNVEYYVSDRVTSPKPRLVVEIVTGGYPVVPAGVVLSADRSQFNTATGRFVVDFSSTAGKTYYIQYSSSPAGPYDTSFPGVAGTGGRLQWVDTGPPRTTSLPAAAGSRFYRILQVP